MSNEPEIDYEKIAAALRESIERQVATSATGQALVAAAGADAVARFVTNVVGNLTYTVAELIETHVTQGARDVPD